jgi:hypothetical protein
VRAVTIGDFNRDGAADFVAAHYAGETSTVFYGDGRGNFPNKLNFSSGAGTLGLAAADFNNDGWLDSTRRIKRRAP